MRAWAVLLLYVSLQQALSEVIEDDNIALPQEEARQYVLPAPGLRRRPGGFQDTPTSFQETVNRFQDLSANIQDSSSNSGVVGQLLPQSPVADMAQVVGLDVACLPDHMLVTVTFSAHFYGLIYAKGHYGDAGCRYVSPGSGQREVVFRVEAGGGGAGQCGVQYVEAAGAPYLQTVLVIQNEPGIQEVWDTARGVRCVYEDGLDSRDGSGGAASHRVSAALNVAMLDQQVVTFSAKTQAKASLDIQVGRGPFAPSASGLVRIGEMMTLVVGVEGPDSADILVRECVAHDGTPDASYQLTDRDGCVLGSRKKVLGSWQKTRDTGTQGFPVIAFSHFQAFKFPDKTDVYIECQVDLCAGSCPVCPGDGAGRKKRAIPTSVRGNQDNKSSEEEENSEAEEGSDKKEEGSRRRNETFGEGVRLARKLRVISPEDFSFVRDTPITLVTKKTAGISDDEMCVSVGSFIAALVTTLLILVLSSTLTAILCLRVRTIPSTASTFPPDSSFHAFSTVSGKTR